MTQYYILWHAEKDVFESCDAALDEAANREGYDTGSIMCMCMNLRDGTDMKDGPIQLEEGHCLFPVESEPVAIYAAPATSEMDIATEFPGKIKEWNIRHMGNAYKDAPIVEKLRKSFDPEQICEVLSILEETNAGR